MSHTPKSKTDLATRLKELRSRVSQLQQRAQGKPDEQALAELRAELGQLATQLQELIQQAGGTTKPTEKSATAWPRDLNEATQPAVWGQDPEEVLHD